MEDVIAYTTPRLKPEEGLRKFLYKDINGHLTGGWGHNFDVKGVSVAVATLMLQEDLTDALNDCKKNIHFWDSLDVVRQSVLLDMAFNMGIHGLLGFKEMLACLEKGDHKGAASAMLDSLENEQVPGRVHPLAVMMES